jgi:hypothetical protein
VGDQGLKMKVWKFVATAVAAIVVTSAAHAAPMPIPTLFNTGVNGAGVALGNAVNDTHWTITSAPPGSTTTNFTVTSAGGFPVDGPWLGDSTTSAWIRPANSAPPNDPVGNYTFQTKFDLTGFALDTVKIVGQWATDNFGLDIIVNGVSTNQTSGGFKGWSSFVILNELLKAGENTLLFVVRNDAGETGNPTGLRVEFTSEAIATPLPAAWLMLLTGFAAFGFLNRRGAKRRASVAAA